ncbi:glutamate-1-semialdehyde 2,1-aminomutase [Lewinella marina]|uniref:Glutamate-1-semialdehyde 2,1-aminomutase n=1 Tax=Neolewinella marina TaxID=438751 RepID=A0A2G0CCP7_9BACT|nr:glutamate-1-semialdehyde 2,1-aminomutase [Neolewinella marina]NJB87560.1 glutamate-1-semialdehyde 2,1-aminomutase [Neolewinella marina]PHK97748.1 glutamate-1-semialdehyde-2,1-aminomutase [Neolewinella marina]
MKFEQRIPRETSARLFEEAQEYFPGGVNSPVRAFRSVSGPPLFIREGHGSHMTDVDGNRFLDFCCSWGPLIHGHDNAHIRERVIETVRRGTSFGTPTEMGNRLGKLILENHRYVERIRFVSSGTEAVMSALRLARGVTGKTRIIKFEGCYHGHVDQLLVKAGSGLVTFGTSSSAGVPESVARDTLVLPLGNRELLEQTLTEQAGQVACIIVEPVPANNGLLIQDKSWLEDLRAVAHKYGVLLIFDEVISGFRVGFEGAAGYYDVQPDIITFGKVIGGGFPVGAYGASKEIMDHIAPVGPVYQAGTLSANPVAMAAGLAALEQCLEPDFYTRLEARTHEMATALEDYARERGYPLHVPHIGSIFWLAFGTERIERADQIDPANMEYFKVIHHELLQTGVYLGPSGYEVGFVSSAHTPEDLEEAVTKICAAMDVAFAR